MNLPLAAIAEIVVDDFQLLGNARTRIPKGIIRPMVPMIVIDHHRLYSLTHSFTDYLWLL